MLPAISIIIPCYNSGQYLTDALDSVKNYAGESAYEIIIIDDGSTDLNTIALLKKLSAEGTNVITQENKGPAAARNAGVKVARGQYLLLLDADNKIREGYISTGISILAAQETADIIYGKPVFFGESGNQRFCTGPFDLSRLLKENYIDTCSIMRKSVWIALNGQDENPAIIGHEDWDFWIRAAEAGFKFYYVDKFLFDYRVSKTSLVTPLMEDGGNKTVLKYLYSKHAGLINTHYIKLYNLFDIYKEDQQKPVRSFIKFLYNKYLRK